MVGIDGVAIGSDFDGALVPAVIGDVSGMPVLWDALAARGYGEDLIRRIAAENWVAMIERSIG